MVISAQSGILIFAAGEYCFHMDCVHGHSCAEQFESLSLEFDTAAANDVRKLSAIVSLCRSDALIAPRSQQIVTILGEFAKVSACKKIAPLCAQRCLASFLV
ncbi:MAG: hypothetical protein ACPHL6_01790 [Rubripirellula sp.]